MFKKIYHSQPVEYISKIEDSVFSPPLFYPVAPYDEGGFFTHGYYGGLEAHAGLLCVFSDRLPNVYSDITIRVFMVNNIYNFPSYGIRDYEFDSAFGVYLNDENVNTPIASEPTLPTSQNFWLLRINDIAFRADGTLMATTNRGISWYNVDTGALKLSLQPVDIDLDQFGATALKVWMVDTENNILIKSKGPSNPTVAEIEIFDTTGGGAELIRTLRVSGIPQQIFPEDERRAYVYCTNGMLNLINYMSGEVLSTLRSPAPVDYKKLFFQIGHTKFCYDRFYRRMIGVTLTSDDQETGASTLHAEGWYPIPVPVRIMKPIPLIPPRVNRITPYLTKIFGDVGEPIGGVIFKATPTGADTTIHSIPVTDDHGEAIINALSASAGELTMELEINV